MRQTDRRERTDRTSPTSGPSALLQPPRRPSRNNLVVDVIRGRKGRPNFIAIRLLQPGSELSALRRDRDTLLSTTDTSTPLPRLPLRLTTSCRRTPLPRPPLLQNFFPTWIRPSFYPQPSPGSLRAASLFLGQLARRLLWIATSSPAVDAVRYRFARLWILLDRRIVIRGRSGSKRWRSSTPFLDNTLPESFFIPSPLFAPIQPSALLQFFNPLLPLARKESSGKKGIRFRKLHHPTTNDSPVPPIPKS